MSKEGEILNDLSDEEVKVDEVGEEEVGETVSEKKSSKKVVEEAETEESEVKEEVPPPKPTRPLTPKQEAEKNLKDAFPSIEAKLITTVLIASNYKLEAAFNSLLYYSDPDSVKIEDLLVEEPSLPARPSQLQQDELLAKQLDQEYKRKERRRERRSENTYLEDDSDVFTNFVEKDLPQIKQQVSKNLEETRSKLNNWIGGWKKNYQEQQEAFQQSRKFQQEQQQRRDQLRTNNQFDDEPEEVDLQKIHGISLNDNTTDELYSKKWEPLKDTKPEPISKEKVKSVEKSGVVDDDFNLSDDEVKK